MRDMQVLQRATVALDECMKKTWKSVGPAGSNRAMSDPSRPDTEQSSAARRRPRLCSRPPESASAGERARCSAPHQFGTRSHTRRDPLGTRSVPVMHMYITDTVLKFRRYILYKLLICIGTLFASSSRQRGIFIFHDTTSSK